MNASIFVSDTPLSPMGPSSPSQEGLFTDLRLLSLEKQLNIELKVDAAKEATNYISRSRMSDTFDEHGCRVSNCQCYQHFRELLRAYQTFDKATMSVPL